MTGLQILTDETCHVNYAKSAENTQNAKKAEHMLIAAIILAADKLKKILILPTHTRVSISTLQNKTQKEIDVTIHIYTLYVQLFISNTVLSNNTKTAINVLLAAVTEQ